MMTNRKQSQFRFAVAMAATVFFLSVLAESIRSEQPNVNAKPNDSVLRYRWDSNREYQYRVSIVAKLDELEFKTTGQCGFKVAPQQGTSKSQSKSEASGSAFVVASDGLLITAAHVVEDATSIKVTLDGQTYTGRVVELDTLQDLALLKIEATNLPALPLTDSEQVGLGQSIWALGYPLSDVLGKSLKINAGMVSGINQTTDGKLFQLNATLNPGNSGGPILNESGHVVGVAIQRLAGRGISDVGLTRPINDAVALMKKQEIKPTAPSKTKRKMDGQAIVNASQKSIAFVEVESDPMRDATKLQLDGFLMTEKKSLRSRVGFSYPSSDSPVHRVVKESVITSPLGALSELGETEELPFALGHIAEFLLEPFDAAGRNEWSHERTSTLAIVEEEKRSPFGPSSPIRPPLSFLDPPSRKDRSKLKIYDLVEREIFKIAKKEGGKTHVEKIIEIKTTDDPKRPFIEMTGKGEWVFDDQEGCLVSSNTKYDFICQASSSVSIRMPIETKITYLDAAVVAESRKRANEQQVAYEAERREKLALEYEQMGTGKNFKRHQKIEFPRDTLIQEIRLSDDGKLFAIGAIDGKIAIYDRTNPKPIKQLDGLKSSARMMEFSPNNQYLIASCGFDGKGWDLQTGESFSLPSQNSSYAEFAAFTADSQFVYLAGSSGGIARFEIKTGQRELVTDKIESSEKMVLLKDGNQLAFSNYRKELNFWNLQSKSIAKTTNPNPNRTRTYQNLVMSPSGRGLFASHDQVDVLKLDDGVNLLEIPIRSSSREGLAISKDGRIAAIIPSGKNVVVWDIENKKRIAEFQIDSNHAKSVALSSNGRFLLTIGSDNVVQSWESLVY
jgi:S1-C subfamily serine protease/WD40 repeat protein